MAKTIPRYVVGYLDARTAWGRRHFFAGHNNPIRLEDYCDSMTWHDARRARRQMPDDSAVVLELVPVDAGTGGRLT